MMSLYQYFSSTPKVIANSGEDNVLADLRKKVGEKCSEKELVCLSEELPKTTKLSKPQKRVTYADSDKRKIAMYAAQNGVANAVRKFQKEHTTLNESTVRPWVKKLKLEMKTNQDATSISIGVKRGRPILLSDELDCKLRTILVNLRTAGSELNIHVVRGVLMGLIRSNPSQFGVYMDFAVTKPWVRSLYRRMNLSRRMKTTSRRDHTCLMGGIENPFSPFDCRLCGNLQYTR